MASTRLRFHIAASKLHKWLALIIGVQLLIWFASGLLMSWWPIDEIHGDHLVDRKTVEMLPAGLRLADPAGYLGDAGMQAERITLRMLNGRAVAEVSGAGKIRLFDATTGAALPPVDAQLATEIAQKAWRGSEASAKVAAVTSASTEYRGALPAWRVSFADPDNTSLFVASETGQITAVRTGTWRLYDFVWGLHIMDWQNHENFNSWWLLGFATRGLLLGLAGTVLLFMRWPLRRRRRVAP